MIAEILEVEKQARRQVEKANEKAKTIRLKAEEEARMSAVSIRDKALKEAQDHIAKAEADAQNQKEKELAKAAQEGKTLWKDKEKEVAGAVDALFKIVLGEGSK